MVVVEGEVSCPTGTNPSVDPTLDWHHSQLAWLVGK